MLRNHEWLDKKTPRSVKSLKLWPENPRLNPAHEYASLRDYAEELLSDEAGELKSFKDLVSSITTNSFIPLDPIVVWKNEENDKFYVAEGNRRVLALKLLLEPKKAPKWVRSFFLAESRKINHQEIEKIKVYVAPSLEDAEWYISQRNNASSLQRSWTRLQQNRWVEHLYKKYNGNIEKIRLKTSLREGELAESIRRVKLLNLLRKEEVRDKIPSDALEEAASHRFPLTIIERFFGNKKVKDSWGVDFEGMELKISSDKSSFYEAFANLVERIVKRDTDENPINTRTITSDIDKILLSLPSVSLNPESASEEPNNITTDTAKDPVEEAIEETEEINTNSNSEKLKKGDIHRDKMILSFYEIHTGNYRLKKQFDELKEITYRKYQSSIASSLRVFLDLAILDYLKTNQLEDDISSKFGNQPLKGILLKKRLEYLKQHKLTSGTKAYKNVVKLMKTDEHYSLDVLNGFVHSDDSHYISKQFLNGFWDFLFPLFQELLEIKEN